MSAHTPGPWRINADWTYEIYGADSSLIGQVVAPQKRADAVLIAAAPKMLEALRAAAGYLLNAKIDLETGVTKRTAISTIEGGLKTVRAAIAEATGDQS